MKQVEFWFDVSSPAAYLAYTQLPRIAEERGAQILWRPMLLGGVFKATGNVSPVEIPAKRRWLFDDLHRWARHYGVRFELNPGFPVNSLTLMRAAVGVQTAAPEQFLHYVDVIFRAIWERPRDLNLAPEVEEVLRDADFDPAWIMALAGDPQVKERLKQNSEEAVARGVFGAPSFFVNEQLFFGQDRLHFVAAALDAPAAQPIDRKSP